MKRITSRKNVEINAISQLAHAKKRKVFRQFIAEGARTINTLMEKLEPIQLYMTEELYAQQLIEVPSGKITLVTDEVLEKISTTKTPQGVVGLFAIPNAPSGPLDKGIVLAHIANPGNMGTLIRTAAAMNCKTIVVVEGVDPWHPKVIQATAGTIAFVDIFELSWHELMQKKNRLSLCALVVHNGQSTEILSGNDILIVVGNEATGIPSELLSQCELSCTIAMPGKTESLNAAIAGSIALYLAFMPK